MYMTVRIAMLCASHFQQVLSSLMWEINSHSTVWAKQPPINIDALVPYHREKNQCMLPAAPRTLPHSNTGQEEGKMDYPTSIQTCPNWWDLPKCCPFAPKQLSPAYSSAALLLTAVTLWEPAAGYAGTSCASPIWILDTCLADKRLKLGSHSAKTVKYAGHLRGFCRREQCCSCGFNLIFFNVDILFVYGCYWELRYNRFWSEIPLQPAQHHFDTSGQGACSAAPRHALKLSTRTSAHWSWSPPCSYPTTTTN